MVALVINVPVYLWVVGMERVLAAAPVVVWIEVLVQGLIAGVGTLYTYSKMVSMLDAASCRGVPCARAGPGGADCLASAEPGAVKHGNGRPADLDGRTVGDGHLRRKPKTKLHFTLIHL